jgi:hypothetical protein
MEAVEKIHENEKKTVPRPGVELISASPSPFQDRGGREGGVVAATSRDTITQHI